ncbi:hypothetical protein [Spirosoma panaciterrae]|uniref:hypothetical protein n=1 Tax=Spirosoma panaciterrae TaxID=496058 RepID=UPI00036C1A2D|nr:hypothetical protein [Spirosoma panaciterrae]
MDYFLRIFCQNENRLPPEEIIAFVKDGFFFEKEPLFLIHQENATDWKIDIIYDSIKSPVTISTSTNDKESQKEIDEIVFILSLPSKKKTKEMILQIIGETKFVYTLKINQAEITNDGWEMLDTIESMLMRSGDGILFNSDNEFFDRNLKKIYKL